VLDGSSRSIIGDTIRIDTPLADLEIGASPDYTYSISSSSTSVNATTIQKYLIIKVDNVPFAVPLYAY
jgi:hypothetical protein